MNQTSHTRPILPSYNQTIGNTPYAFAQTNLRLPEYKENYLSRYTPYARYTAHHRFYVHDDVPSYAEATAGAGLPTRRAPLENSPERVPAHPAQAEIIRNRIKDFFESLRQLRVEDEEGTANENKVNDNA